MDKGLSQVRARADPSCEATPHAVGVGTLSGTCKANFRRPGFRTPGARRSGTLGIAHGHGNSRHRNFVTSTRANLRLAGEGPPRAVASPVARECRLSDRERRPQVSGDFSLPSIAVGEQPILVVESSSRVSVANSKLGPSTIASTGHASWQKPQ